MTKDNVRQKLPDNGHQLNNKQNSNGNDCIDAGSKSLISNEFSINAGNEENINITEDSSSNSNEFRSRMLSEMPQQLTKNPEMALHHMKNLFDHVLREVNSDQEVQGVKATKVWKMSHINILGVVLLIRLLQIF